MRIKDMETLLAQARLDGDSGPARTIAPAAKSREIADVFARRDALLQARRRWVRGAALGGLLIGVASIIALAVSPSTRGVAARADERPTVASVLEQPREVAPPVAPPVVTVPTSEPRSIDVASLPSSPTATAMHRSSATPPPAAPSLRTATEETAAEDLLRTANRLRAEKKWTDAARVYERVLEMHGHSAQAYPAMMSAASLRLDRLGDPAGALALYQRALSARPTGPLADEARFGEARAYGALGRTDEERAALRRFLASHPASWLADEARQRLGELEAGHEN